MKLPITATVLQTGAASEGLARDWAPALSGADKNRGYAFQWFALSGLVAVLFVWFQIILVLRRAPPTQS
jgi:surfeit locus 1 family protein